MDRGRRKQRRGGFLSLSARAVEAKMVIEKGKGTSLGKSGGKIGQGKGTKPWKIQERDWMGKGTGTAPGNARRVDSLKENLVFLSRKERNQGNG